jgi:hypothetical protein
MNRHAQQRNAQRASDQRAISAFWSRAEKHRGEQLIAAKAILETPASIAQNGGEGAAVVAWARLTLRNDAERRAAR